MPNFTDMLSKAKEMQEKMKEAQDMIKKIEVEGESGGNLVKVILSFHKTTHLFLLTEGKVEEFGMSMEMNM